MSEPRSNDDAGTLLSEVRAARTFDEGARALLRRLLARSAQALEQSPFKGQGRIARGMVHLRPDGEYRALAALEWGEGGGEAAAASLLPSTTAWRWVSGSGHPVAVDVTLGQVQQLGGPAQVARDPALASDLGRMNETRGRLLGRDATHVCALPLRGLRGAVEGMVSLEAECRAALGRPFVWDSALADLQLYCDAAAPHLSQLPGQPRPAPAEEDPLLPVVGPSMARLMDVLSVFAAQGETILISGPTGTGKSRLARWCHAKSPRGEGPFEALDLSAVPEELQLGELFGWRKGAFTGALRDNPGLLARAAGGTLFIDEIDKLSLRAQAGLLHVLEERTYRVLGEGVEKTADARFVVGTNADLRGEVDAGRFREDLYYRVHVLPVSLPPLRERPDEIPLWARYMLKRRHRDAVPDGSAQLSEAAERALSARPWPGNLRQLDNIIRRAYSLAVMATKGAPPKALTLEEREVTAALGLEGGRAEGGGVVSLLERAASALAARAQRGPELDLDLADAFKGLLLAAAVDAAGGRDEAFKALGREALVRNRNHHKVLRRELERVEALCRALGEPVPASVASLLAQGEK